MSENVERKIYPGIIQKRLGIEVTTKCNIDCPHCFARAGLSDPSSLTVELVKEIVAEGYSIGYRHLHITGGEPLLWKGIFELFDYAYSMGYQTVFCNTNGTLLTAEIAARLATYDDLSISVSVDGPEALHDRFRAQGSYRRTMVGIEKALEAGVDLCIFTLASKRLLPLLSFFVEDLYQKFPTIRDLSLIQLIPTENKVSDLSEECLGPGDLLKFIKMVALFNLLGHRTRFLNNPLAYVASALLGILWIPRSQPLYCEGSLIVMANRDIRLAHSLRCGFGKYQSGMIGKVLDSDGYLKAVSPDQKTCPLCKYADLCQNNGMAFPSETYWGIHTDAHYCQNVLKRAETEHIHDPTRLE